MNTPRWTIRLDVSLQEAVKEAARESRQTASEWVRDAIDAKLGKEPQGSPAEFRQTITRGSRPAEVSPGLLTPTVTLQECPTKNCKEVRAYRFGRWVCSKHG